MFLTPTQSFLLGLAITLTVLLLVQRILRNEARFRMLAENGGDVICLHGADGACLYVSPSVTRVLGYKSPQCPTQHIHPEDKAHFLCVFNTVLHADEPVRCTFRVQTAQGDMIWLESLMRPLPSGGAIVTSRDVTDRKQVEDLYRILADSLPKNSFVLYNKGLRVMLAAGPMVRLNESLLGKLEGRHMVEVFRHLLDPEQFAAEERSWIEALGGRNAFSEIPLRGSIYRIQHVPVIEGEVVIAGLMVATNVTEDRAHEAVLRDRTEELERSNRDLEQFADIASHELKTPLRHISSFAGILADERRACLQCDCSKGLLSTEAEEYITRIVAGVQEMQGVVEALLRYSRAKTHEGRMQSVDMAYLVKQVVASLDPRVQEVEGNIEVDWSTLPTVRGDPVLLKQLVENLVWNGLKFSKPNPVVRVYAERDLLDWVFTVEDNGFGVEPEHREFIFQMFKRSRTDVEGSGIGLALCKKIVGIHRGRIWIETGSGTGHRPGATFKFSIPARVRDENTKL